MLDCSSTYQTASSNQHNLYFVAHGGTVAVFQPSIPFQHLGPRPRLNITPALANPQAPGYLSPSRPHSINHLVIGDLGSKEILFLSTDSGNVAAYYTGVIQKGIDKEPCQFGRDGRSDLVGIRPFFAQWVGESAWGLSIHRNARMLAVSSNIPASPALGDRASITVFAFALTTSSTPSLQGEEAESTPLDTDESDWKSWIPGRQRWARLPNRSINWRTRLEAHNGNIPSISFVNSDEDLQGKYLSSTDINGITRFWWIWSGAIITQHDFSVPLPQSLYPPPFNGRHTAGGWTVLSLDKDCFQVVHAVEESFGYGAYSVRDYADITGTLREIPRPYESLPTIPFYSPNWEEEEVIAEYRGPTENVILHVGGDISGSNATARRSIDLDSQSSLSDNGQSDGHSLGNNEIDSPLVVYRQLAERELGIPAAYYSNTTYDIETRSVGVKKMRIRPSTALPIEQRRSRLTPPKMPTLHLSASNLRLFDAYSPRQATVVCSDVIAFQRPIYYNVNPGLDRLNMTQYIPELGVVVIAAQTGRAAVCSLTTRGAEGPFGVRVDYILPFEEQEEEKERPKAHLVGIAVSPVRGYHSSRSKSGLKSDEDEGSDQPRMCNQINKGGAPITFDRDLVTTSSLLPAPPSPPSSQSSSNNSHSGRNSNNKRGNSYTHPSGPKRLTFTSKSPRAPPPAARPKQKWTTIEHPSSSRSQARAGLLDSRAGAHESWHGVEYSRRYRLMMTYADHGVMTYELSRRLPSSSDPVLGKSRTQDPS